MGNLWVKQVVAPCTWLARDGGLMLLGGWGKELGRFYFLHVFQDLLKYLRLHGTLISIVSRWWGTGVSEGLLGTHLRFNLFDLLPEFFIVVPSLRLNLNLLENLLLHNRVQCLDYLWYIAAHLRCNRSTTIRHGTPIHPVLLAKPDNLRMNCHQVIFLCPDLSHRLFITALCKHQVPVKFLFKDNIPFESLLLSDFRPQFRLQLFHMS